MQSIRLDLSIVNFAFVSSKSHAFSRVTQPSTKSPSKETCILQPLTANPRTRNLSIATVDHEPRCCCTCVPMTCQLGQSGSDQDRTSARRLRSSTSVGISHLILPNRPNWPFTIFALPRSRYRSNVCTDSDQIVRERGCRGL